MGIFDSEWQRLHKKISRQYELIAMRNFETGGYSKNANMLEIIAKIVKENIPNLSHAEATDFVKNEYQSFKDFDVCETISNALRHMKPDISEAEVSEIFEAVRRRFHDSEREYGFFLFFVISKIIELRNMSISRGSYLIEISRGRIPGPSRLVRFFQLWRQIARYKIVKDRMKG